jgi:hypothetical protein
MKAQTRGEVASSLVAEVLHSRGTVQLRATGASMLPTLWPGDLLTIQSRKLERVQAGELALYSREGRFFIHRVVRKRLVAGEPALVTRGDCMSQDDPPVRPAELLGTVTGIARDGSWLAPATRLGWLQLTFARLFCHWDLFRRVVLRLHGVHREALS